MKDTLDSTVENVGTLQEGLGLGRRGLLDAINEIVANEVQGVKDTLDSTVENVGSLQEGLGLRKRYGVLDAINDIVANEVEGLKDTLDSTVENVSLTRAADPDTALTHSPSAGWHSRGRSGSGQARPP